MLARRDAPGYGPTQEGGDMRLAGKRVLVLGASSGLGKASAVQIAREGARVCVAARRVDRLEETVREAGPEAFALVCDVRDEASCRAVVEAAVAEMGGLDAVVYSPGISTFGPIEEISQADWHAVLETNLIGVSLILNTAIAHLTQTRGKVVVISSISIDDSPPRPQQATYIVSKRALEALIEAWQGEHRAVAFTSIASGDTLSEFGLDHDVEKLMPIVQRWTELDYLYGRMMEPDAVAEQVVNALASRETIRRIAITPAYPEASEEQATDRAEAVIRQQRGSK
jgi:NAD(P)-dependent dehydrogenase (short-subunit alcohol dehydrogenase family)